MNSHSESVESSPPLEGVHMVLAVLLVLSVLRGLVSLMFGLSRLRLLVLSKGLAAKILGIIVRGPLIDGPPIAVRPGEPITI